MRVKTKPEDRVLYRIVVAGEVDLSWSDWFHGFKVEPLTDGEGRSFSILSGSVVDQVELRGILNKVWNLNLELVSVDRLDIKPVRKR